jgi:SSS family solute:Na+ symporter
MDILNLLNPKTSLFIFVLIYLLFSIIVGILAGKKMKTSSDFVNAGRRLPVSFVMAMVFATWFGSEALLGMPAEFIKYGFAGVIKDPIGAFFCLLIIGFVFAKKWYNLNVFTLASIYQKRFGSKIESIATICIVISYFGWVAAQFTALGLTIHLLSFGSISFGFGILIGALVVLAYTISGGMLSIAINDFIQFFVIIISLIYMLLVFADLSGGFINVIQHANDRNMFVLLKENTGSSSISFFSALITLMLGSIPQQDLFQRVTSAKSASIAQKGMILGAFLYLIFCLIPIFLVFSANIIDSELVNKWINEDSQMILPNLILNHMPLLIQVLFFGSLVSAIMSTASGTLIAPSVVITENFIKKFFPKMSDFQYILTLRLVILTTGILVTIFALSSNNSIYEMVGDAYKITLVTSVAPLVACLFWKRATTAGAFASMILGFLVWISGEFLHIKEPQLYGFIISCIAMIVVSYSTKKQPDEIIYRIMTKK